jgi:serine/threonine protein kinase
MMYEMVVGENPFKITREEELIKIVKDEIKIPSYLSISEEVRDFLDRCLQKNPAERASIKELMTHAFFKKNQEKNDKSKLINL